MIIIIIIIIKNKYKKEFNLNAFNPNIPKTKRILKLDFS